MLSKHTSLREREQSNRVLSDIPITRSRALSVPEPGTLSLMGDLQDWFVHWSDYVQETKETAGKGSEAD